MRPGQRLAFVIPSRCIRLSKSRSLADAALYSALAFKVASPCLKFGCCLPRWTVSGCRAPCIRHVGIPKAAGFWQGSRVRFERALQRRACPLLIQGKGICRLLLTLHIAHHKKGVVRTPRSVFFADPLQIAQCFGESSISTVG